MPSSRGNGDAALNLRIADYTSEVQDALRRSIDVDLAVAFASTSGVRYGQIEPALEQILRRGGHVRVLLDLRLGNTHPDFLDLMLGWATKGLRVECRSVRLSRGTFHPKVYIFRLADETVRVIIGSANFTGDAYRNNLEFGVSMLGDAQNELITRATEFFESLWGDRRRSRPIDRGAAELYRQFWQRRQRLDQQVVRKTETALAKLEEHLNAASAHRRLQWPAADAAFLLGCLTARGSIQRDESTFKIDFRYGNREYSKGNIAFKADRVVSLAPQHVARRIARVTGRSNVLVEAIGYQAFTVKVDCRGDRRLLADIGHFFRGRDNNYGFEIPNEVLMASRDIQEEFLRGYGLVCALVSKGTYDPTHHHQVWLRPPPGNKTQFDQLVSLLEDSLGIRAYTHWRDNRDVEVKVRCESWMEIGFGIDWMDALVKEGARLNETR